MLNLGVLTDELIESRPYYKAFSPGPVKLLAGRPAVIAGFCILPYKILKSGWKLRKVATGKLTAAEYAGDALATSILWIGLKPIKRTVGKTHMMVQRQSYDWFRKNGMGGRTLITRPGTYDLVITFHDANRAGPHIDVHIGRTSVVYRVKPDLYAQLRYNNQGYLTANSQKLLLDHVRSELDNRSRVPLNLDHSRANARSAWVGGSRDDTHYGAGVSRQIILDDKVQVYKVHDGVMEMYAPALEPDASLYLYQVYSGKPTPIMIFGRKNHTPPKLEDRLHLKLVTDEQEYDRLQLTNATVKYDGSSSYLVIGPKGTEIFSPRKSVVSGKQIVYTHKLNGLASVKSDETIVAMGEIMFKDQDGNYLPSAVGSGILNSHDLVPSGVEAEVRLYRVDRIGRRKTIDLPFEENRKLQYQVAKLHPQLEVVEFISPEDAHKQGLEGVVAVKPGTSVVDGYKYKFVDDPEDWVIDKVAFKLGEKGKVAGVVHATNTHNGRQYKLGPGQMGNEALTTDMMTNPHNYEGRTIKVASRRGHSGRAAKVVGFHDDK